MSSTRDHSTHRRLLESAAGLFAEQGYAATSVRQVCSKADANIAAVNYHFGSKQGLYDATIDFARAESNARNPWVDRDTKRDFWSDAPAPTRLKYFISMMLDHSLDQEGRASDLARIMLHEMLDPTPAFDRQIEVSIGRVFEALRSICREIAEPGVSEDEIARLSLMVNAQCMYPSLVADTFPRLHPGICFDQEGRSALAETVTSSTLIALRALRPKP